MGHLVPSPNEPRMTVFKIWSLSLSLSVFLAPTLTEVFITKKPSVLSSLIECSPFYNIHLQIFAVNKFLAMLLIAENWNMKMFQP